MWAVERPRAIIMIVAIAIFVVTIKFATFARRPILTLGNIIEFDAYYGAALMRVIDGRRDYANIM
ncbi:MAG: hypothetical protein LBN22_08140 [Clostridiales Family XIII bacterium]|jgi:ABC-type enterochelin transport system permease subunit|nr:hypothetical protein [Clostridiales Family XIII bacterium]